MPSTEVQRTLVKSPPELWAELSDPEALARRLGAFGEIRITRLQPESSVAWEGEHASGTVELQPSGWGTKVTLTVEEAAAEPEAAPEPEPEPEPAPAPEPVAEAPPAPTRRGFFARFRRRSLEVPPAPDPAPDPPDPGPIQDPMPPPPDPGPPAAAASAPVQDVLAGVLDDLGSAHHRPFSRG